ncbi:hypothetical protein BDB00DRAFT_935436 [Zychaea mexicana]|uniref:uncharacterized protein n=1 Tax=Zychaea mexicana TaxID=64656 RepID=UPI0022FDF75A|nr:uncharacterized protein BDB00DRAFT_935436 [Zychaea mexicana]KAI9498724.1 hypothetical protein BDB00DRAFT_935436 [Zychaea mexicana]
MKADQRGTTNGAAGSASSYIDINKMTMLGFSQTQIEDMVQLALTVSPSQRRRRPRIRKRDPTRVPRPMNCFLAYRLEKQKQIAAICPGTNHREISKVVAKWWSEEPEVEKQKYRDLAEQDKRIHKEKYPGYKYAPKKKRQRPATDISSRTNKFCRTGNSEKKENSVAVDCKTVKMEPLPSPVNEVAVTATGLAMTTSDLQQGAQQQNACYYNTSPVNQLSYPSEFPWFRPTGEVVLPALADHSAAMIPTTSYEHNSNLTQDILYDPSHESSFSNDSYHAYTAAYRITATGSAFWAAPVNATFTPPMQHQQSEISWVSSSYNNNNTPPSSLITTPSTVELSPIYEPTSSGFDVEATVPRWDDIVKSAFSHYSQPEQQHDHQQQLVEEHHLKDLYQLDHQSSYNPTPFADLNEPLYADTASGISHDISLLDALHTIETIAPSQIHLDSNACTD